MTMGDLSTLEVIIIAIVEGLTEFCQFRLRGT